MTLAPSSASGAFSLTREPPRALGRYEILGRIARGGMATVYLARHAGGAGFQRLFAIKVLHPHLAEDGVFVEMLLDEARIAARLHHPNVVPIVDLGTQDEIHYVVLEYIEGCSMSALLSHYRESRPPRVLISIILDMLSGLHAAHSLTDDHGVQMRLVHRDVSPQNVMVGSDGSARITDFGIAKAEARIGSTRPGQLKGKLAFMSPEQIRNLADVDHRADIFAAGALLWMSLTGRRLFLGDSDGATISNVLSMAVPAPSTIGFKPPAAIDAVCLRALARDRNKRFASALEMEEALREVAIANGLLGSKREVAEWVNGAFAEKLRERRQAIAAAASRPRARASINPEASQPVPMSGMRTIPGLTPITSADLIDTPASSLPSNAPTMSVTYSSKSRKSVFAAGGLLLVAAALAVWLTSRATAPTVVEPLTTAPVSERAKPSSAPVATAAPSPSPPPPSAAPAPQPSRVSLSDTGRTRSWPRRAQVPPKQRPEGTSEPRPEPAPAAATAKKSPTWESDSPLPPP